MRATSPPTIAVTFPYLPWALLCLSYLLGGLMPGYWLVLLRRGADVREHGSGGTGATNVGRVLGPWGFGLVLVLDAAKGALAVWLARHFAADCGWAPWACAFAVLLGHVWPALLSFRGGKGVATLVGAWLVLLPASFLLCVPVFLVTYLFLRRFTLAGLCGLGLLPTGAAWASNWGRLPALWAFLSLVVIIIAHRDHLRRWLRPDESAR